MTAVAGTLILAALALVFAMVGPAPHVWHRKKRERARVRNAERLVIQLHHAPFFAQGDMSVAVPPSLVLENRGDRPFRDINVRMIPRDPAANRTHLGYFKHIVAGGTASAELPSDDSRVVVTFRDADGYLWKYADVTTDQVLTRIPEQGRWHRWRKRGRRRLRRLRFWRR